MRDSRWRFTLLAAGLLIGLCAAPSPVFAKSDEAENRLRAALREATVQLRTLEDQNAQLQAKQAEADRAQKELTGKLDAAQKELDEQRARGKADADALQKSQAKNEATEASLAKWQTAYKDAAETARTRDADANKLDADVQRLAAEAKRRDAALVQTRELKHACEAKNDELFKLGNEMLDFYDQKSFLGNLASREPVTQLKRVEYENIMQDYEDKLRANEVVPPSQ